MEGVLAPPSVGGQNPCLLNHRSPRSTHFKPALPVSPALSPTCFLRPSKTACRVQPGAPWGGGIAGDAGPAPGRDESGPYLPKTARLLHPSSKVSGRECKPRGRVRHRGYPTWVLTSTRAVQAPPPRILHSPRPYCPLPPLRLLRLSLRLILIRGKGVMAV